MVASIGKFMGDCWSVCKSFGLGFASPLLFIMRQFSSRALRNLSLFIAIGLLGAFPYVLQLFWKGTASNLFLAFWGIGVFFLSLSVAFVYFLVEQDLESLANGFVYRPSPEETLDKSIEQPVARYLAFERELTLTSLLVACLGMSIGFTMLSQGLYNAGFKSWYLTSGQSLSFWNWYLYTLLSIFRALDIFDTLTTYGITIPFIKHAAWPTSTIVFLFKATFDIMLLSQLRSWWQRYSTIKQAVRALRHYKTSKRAAETLVRIGNRAVPLLMDALKNNSNDEARIYAAEALKSLNAKEAIPLFLEVLETDSSYNVRLTAVEVLSDWGVIEAIPKFRACLVEDTHDEVREKVVIALGHLKVKESIPELERVLLNDSAEEVRNAAVLVLRNMDAKEITPSLVTALEHDTGEDVRTNAAEALGSLQAKEAIPSLERALQSDQDYRVRRNSVIALRLLGSTESSQLFIQTLRSDSTARVRREAIEAIRVLNLRDAVSLVMESLERDPDFFVRQKAAEVLGEWGVPEAIPALQNALNDPDVCEEARVALERLGIID